MTRRSIFGILLSPLFAPLIKFFPVVRKFPPAMKWFRMNAFITLPTYHGKKIVQPFMDQTNKITVYEHELTKDDLDKDFSNVQEWKWRPAK